MKNNVVDLLITDVVFPNSSIKALLDFIKIVRKTQPQCKILAVSDIADKRDKILVLDAGANLLIPKGLNADFLKAVSDVLKGEHKTETETENNKKSFPSFNVRELEIIQRLNLSNKEISEQIFLSVKGTDDRVAKLLSRFEGMNRTDLYAWWVVNQDRYLKKDS